MRRVSAVLAVVGLSLFLGLGTAAFAQTNTSLPLPAGRGGPDNGVNNVQDANAPAGGATNPAANAGPATKTSDGSSLAPWLVAGAVLVVLAAGGVFAVRRAGARREPSYSGRSTNA